MLAAPTHDRLARSLRYMLDENQFLSSYGLRSVSRVHRDKPYVFVAGHEEHRVDYVPGEGTSDLFGGNSNWRGPIWFPINYLIIEALERYHHFYGDKLKVECPVGSGKMLTLQEVAQELSRRLSSIFLSDEHGERPCHGGDKKYSSDPCWRDLVLFHEYFHDKLRDECLNRELFGNLREARAILESWRVEYNERRPHSSLGYRTPNEYARSRTNRFDGGCAPPTPAPLVAAGVWGELRINAISPIRWLA